MAEGITLTPEALRELLRTAIAEATKLNPLEQKKYDEEMAKEHRKNEMMRQLGRIEEEAARAKKNSCSHMRYSANAGRHAGHSAPKGTMGAEWCTGGQAYQDGTAMVICLRCSSTWLFRPDAGFYSEIVQNGLLGYPPPPDEITLCPGCMELKPKCRCKELYLLMKAETAANAVAAPVAA